MDKSVLLVLLCLQVFLLITAFTSTDAAAVVRDDQLPPDQVERINGNRPTEVGYYSGGTALAFYPAPPSPPFPPSPAPLRPDTQAWEIKDQLHGPRGGYDNIDK